jgi:hypothetical protein
MESAAKVQGCKMDGYEKWNGDIQFFPVLAIGGC